MSIQSNVQQLLQATEGLQTTAQSGVPSGVNNGNPNSVYNWSSYIPSILRNTQGQPTGANFNLLTSQPQASSPPGVNTGYTPPFTADPFAAMLMAQLSQYRGPSASQLPGYGVGNPMIANILRNLVGNYVAAPRPGTAPPAAGGGTTVPPVITVPPVTTAPPGSGPIGTTPQAPGNPGSGLGGGGLNEAGPISMPGTYVPYGTGATTMAPNINSSSVGTGSFGTVGGGGSTGGNVVGSGVGTVPGAGTALFNNYLDNPSGTLNPGSNFDFGLSGGGSSVAPSSGGIGSWISDHILDPIGAGLGNIVGATGWGDDIAGNASMPQINPQTIGLAVGALTNPFGTAAAVAPQIIRDQLGNMINPNTTAPSLPAFDPNNLTNIGWNGGYEATQPWAPETSTAVSDWIAQQQAAANASANPADMLAEAGQSLGGVPATTAPPGTYTSGPYAGMTEQAVRDMMATQTAFSQMQMAQEQARLAAELEAFVSNKEQ